MSDSALTTGRVGQPTRQIGRYGIFHQIAAGGMATVHLARLAGPVGFARVVAVKHLHPHLSLDPRFKSMLIDEARLAVRVRHPNVVTILDVVVADAELFLVMEYVQGEALSQLRRAARRQNQAIPVAVASAIMVGALQGLHAAHEARGENGELLNLVHRDVSPPNILVGVDGVPMVLDFGVAKAAQNIQHSRPGMLKGKSSYMAPEQIRGEPVSRSTDIFAAAIVLWELLTGQRLFGGSTEQERMLRVLAGTDVRPSAVIPEIPVELDELVMRGLHPQASERFQTALEMAEALEQVSAPASQRAVGEWVARTAVDTLARRAEAFKEVEAAGALVPVAHSETGSLELRSVVPQLVAPTPSPLRLRLRRIGIPALAVGIVAAAITLGSRGVARPVAKPRPQRAAASAPPSPPSSMKPLVVPRALPVPVAAPRAEAPRVQIFRRKVAAKRDGAPARDPAAAAPVRPRLPLLVEEPERLRILD